MRRVVLLLAVLFLRASFVYADTIKINEFASDTAGTTVDPDWVELYVEGVDISLYQLIDKVGNVKSLSTVECVDRFCTVDWSNRLNKTGDVIKLTLISDPDSILDQVGYGDEGSDVLAPSTGQSAARTADGVGLWALFSLPTKGSSNNTSTPIPTATPTSTSTPTPQPAPTSIPTATPKSTPTLAPSLTPKVSLTARATATLISKPAATGLSESSGEADLPQEVLGTRDEEMEAVDLLLKDEIDEKVEDKSGGEQGKIKKVLLGLGVAFISAGGLAWWVKEKRF